MRFGKISHSYGHVGVYLQLPRNVTLRLPVSYEDKVHHTRPPRARVPAPHALQRFRIEGQEISTCLKLATSLTTTSARRLREEPKVVLIYVQIVGELSSRGRRGDDTAAYAQSGLFFF